MPGKRPGRRVPKSFRPVPVPLAPGLPAEREISVFDSLDERHAVKHFLGKDLDQAQELFRENFLYYQEDLLWMGPVAFRFYVNAAISYLLSEEANLATDAASSFCGLIEFRLEHEPAEIAPVALVLCEAIQAMLSNFDRFGFAEFGYIYGDVAGRYRDLLNKLKP